MSRLDRNELQRSINALQTALIADVALDWLCQYGHQGLRHSGDGVLGSFHEITVKQCMGSACTGAKEARFYLDAAAREMAAQIIDRAIAIAESDLARSETKP